MSNTIGRVLCVLGLLEARPAWTARELAERLGVTERTVRNDVGRLRELGYPVEAQAGVGGGYRLGAGGALPPLLLDDDEAVALAVALRVGAGTGAGRIEESALRALGKLDHVLPSRLRRRVAAISGAIAPTATGAPTIDPELFVTISAACRDSEGLRFSYRTHMGETQLRRVEPHQLVHLGRFWYLVAWDRDREDWRTFRLDRVTGIPHTDQSFRMRPAPPGGFAAHVANRRKIHDRWQAEVVLHGPHAKLAAKIPPSYGTLDALGADRCVLRAGAEWLGALAVHLAMLDVDFEVRSPPELVSEVDRLADRFDRARRRSNATTDASKADARKAPPEGENRALEPTNAEADGGESKPVDGLAEA